MHLISILRGALLFAMTGLAACGGGGAAATGDGAAGTSGTAGTTGTAGTSGEAGTSGAAGTTGAAGTGALGTPEALATVRESNGTIAANATHVYFEARGNVNRIPVAGGTAEPVITGNQGVASIALDDTTVYVLDNGGFTVTNGVIKALAFASIPGTATRLLMNQSNVSDLLAAGDDLVWVSGTVAATTIKRIPKTSTTVVAVADLGNQAWFGGMASVGANIYFGHRMALVAGVSAAPRAGGGVATPLVTGQQAHVLSLTADADGIYFTTGTNGNGNALDGKLWKAPLAGGAPVMLASSINEPGRVVADGPFVYWLDQGMYDGMYKQGSISKVAKSGGAPTTVVAGVDGFAKHAYTISGSALFYLTPTIGAGPDGQLFKVAK